MLIFPKHCHVASGAGGIQRLKRHCALHCRKREITEKKDNHNSFIFRYFVRNRRSIYVACTENGTIIKLIESIPVAKLILRFMYRREMDSKRKSF